MKSRNAARPIWAAAAMAFLAVSPALAHHSYAMFDLQKVVTLEGTVREFQWTNPHSWIQLITVDAAGKETEWSIELAAPTLMARQGWSRTSLSPGDRIEVKMHPLKHGEGGGSMVSVTMNGAVIGGTPPPKF